MSNLVIPVKRDLVVMATGTQPESVRGQFRISADDGETFLVGTEMGQHEPDALNRRARRAMVLLTGLHFEFYGEVTIFDLDDDTIGEVMEDLK